MENSLAVVRTDGEDGHCALFAHLGVSSNVYQQQLGVGDGHLVDG